MNPLYLYILYAVLALAFLILIGVRIKKIYFPKNKITISNDLKETSKNSGEHLSEEIVNAVRAPKQGEFALNDPNENRYISIHLASKIDEKPRLQLLKTKITASGLKYHDGFFEQNVGSSFGGFLVINGEEPGIFSEEKEISLVTIVLHLKGQKNVLKTFEQMLNLARNLSTSFDMKLLDDQFNSISDQTIKNYQDQATEIDIKMNSYVS